MKVIALEEAERALAEQMAYEARIEYGGRQRAEDYLLIAKAYFQNCPVIEAEPVRRGRWLINKEDGWITIAPCSVCGGVQDVDFPYCPNCGAQMEEGEEQWNK